MRAGVEHCPALVLLDAKLLGGEVAEMIRSIKAVGPRSRCLILADDVEQLLEQAVGHGAWGVLDKLIDVRRALDMIESIKPDGILIVDDDADFVASIKDLLAGAGYMVFVTGNGQEAIERIRSDGIVGDINNLRSLSISGVLRKPFDPRELLDAIEGLSRARKG